MSATWIARVSCTLHFLATTHRRSPGRRRQKSPTIQNECVWLMSGHPSQAIVVLMTASNRDEASRLAEMLVSSRLAACVQILPEMRSVYRWHGKVEHADEALLLAKTTSDKFAELDRAVR